VSTQTLAELALFAQDDLVGGVAEDIVTVNPIFDFIPFIGYAGPGVLVNRENALGDAGMYGVGDTITHRAPSTATQFTYTATKIIGQVDMDELVQLQGESDAVDMTAQEISSKSKNVGRRFQTGMAIDDGVGNNMNSLHSLVDSEQFTTASAGQALSFELLDELLELVTAKDGEVDFLMAHRTVLRVFKTLYRALGGAAPETVVINMPDGTTRTVVQYEDIPFFRNDYLSVQETANGAALTGGALTSVWAGVWDDGSRKVGCAAIYPEASVAGIQVKAIGTSETKDEQMWRIKMYTEWVHFNRRGVARLPSIDITL
jgi:hypothetical protein